MLDKNRIYTYGELKEIFENIKKEILLNPFGEKENDEKLTGETKFMVMLTAIPIIHNLEEKLFGKKEEN